VPTHGSPNAAVLAETVHDAFPTHALESSETEFRDLQAPSTNAPHEPVGVP